MYRRSVTGHLLTGAVLVQESRGRTSSPNVTDSSSLTATESSSLQRAASSTWDAPPAILPSSCPAHSPTRYLSSSCCRVRQYLQAEELQQSSFPSLTRLSLANRCPIPQYNCEEAVSWSLSILCHLLCLFSHHDAEYSARQCPAGHCSAGALE